ncbi:MAG: hypothetical protein GC157_01475 [Frankiales bacterium]|nr:hypothetical protein [Frankiales bacterium]
MRRAALVLALVAVVVPPLGPGAAYGAVLPATARPAPTVGPTDASAGPAADAGSPALPPRDPAPAGAHHRRLPLPWTGPVFAVGDSVMLGALRCLPAYRIEADARGNRQAWQGAALLAARRSHLPHVVVVHLGTNGGIDRTWIDTIMRTLGHGRRVVWVTLQLRNDYARYSYEDSSNAAIRAVVRRYPNARMADWNAVSEPHRSQWLWADGIHLRPEGCRAYARLVAHVARAATV